MSIARSGTAPPSRPSSGSTRPRASGCARGSIEEGKLDAAAARSTSSSRRTRSPTCATSSKRRASFRRWARRVSGGDARARRSPTAYTAEVVRTLRSGVDLGQTETYPAHRVLGTRRRRAPRRSAPRTSPRGPTSESSRRALPRARRARRTSRAAARSGSPTRRSSRCAASSGSSSTRRVIPIAQDIHRKDVLIPMELVEAMSDLGVFGMTIPEAYGGLGLGKIAMCVMTEELSRGYIGVGSLGTRARDRRGADPRRRHRGAEAARGSPRIATRRRCCPRPSSPSRTTAPISRTSRRARDARRRRLAHRRQQDLDHARVPRRPHDAPRAHRPGQAGHGGLSMFLAPKTQPGKRGRRVRRTQGLTGTEIKVLGYRGMKEYELSFDGFAVPEGALLGGGAVWARASAAHGDLRERAHPDGGARRRRRAGGARRGARSTRGSACSSASPSSSWRASRGSSGGWCAGPRPLASSRSTRPRMKDSGKRCDLEAGMAKLLATRAAWECADAAVQIHGGNGYAEEYTV